MKENDTVKTFESAKKLSQILDIRDVQVASLLGDVVYKGKQIYGYRSRQNDVVAMLKRMKDLKPPKMRLPKNIHDFRRIVLHRHDIVVAGDGGADRARKARSRGATREGPFYQNLPSTAVPGKKRQSLPRETR